MLLCKFWPILEIEALQFCIIAVNYVVASKLQNIAVFYHKGH